MKTLLRQILGIGRGAGVPSDVVEDLVAVAVYQQFICLNIILLGAFHKQEIGHFHQELPSGRAAGRRPVALTDVRERRFRGSLRNLGG